MSPIRHAHSRGFAIAFAVTLLGLVAVVIMLLTKQVGYEFRRTTLAGADAELRQMLLAGAWSTQEHAAGWGESPALQSWSVELPNSLAQAGASASIECAPGKDGELDAVVTARINGHEAVQTLRLIRPGGTWVVSDVRWGG